MERKTGTKLRELSSEEKKSLGLSCGVEVLGPVSGLLSDSSINEGFIITKIDGKLLVSMEQLEHELRKKEGVMIEGIYPDGTNDRYFTKGFEV